MVDEVLHEEEQVINVRHINYGTRDLFVEMLNKVGNSLKVGNSVLKYGDALKVINPEELEALFNRWVSRCCNKNIMRKTLSRNKKKQLEWAQELSDVERAFQGMEVLKEMM